jgi:hypothetical protein
VPALAAIVVAASVFDWAPTAIDFAETAVATLIGPRLEEPFPIDLLEFIDEEAEIVVVALSRAALW